MRFISDPSKVLECRVLSGPEYRVLRQLARQGSPRARAIVQAFLLTPFFFGSHSLRKGVRPLVVKEVLGHSSLVSTERYLHLLRESMCAELEKHAL